MFENIKLYRQNKAYTNGLRSDLQTAQHSPIPKKKMILCRVDIFSVSGQKILLEKKENGYEQM